MNSISQKQKEGNDQAPIIFEFEGKGQAVQEIQMNDLRRSIRRESGLAGIRSIPIQFWNLYAAIVTMLDSEEFNFEEKPIWVQNNSSKAYLTDEEKEAGYTQKLAPINRWRFDKIIGMIDIPGVYEGQDEGTSNARNASIGLTLNKEGVSVAFGMNVHACKNFNVMGGTIMRSWGTHVNNRLSKREAMPWDLMEHRLSQWVKNLNQIWSVQNEVMHVMKNTTMPNNDEVIEELIGSLYIGALKQAYFKGSPVPFNTHELSDFVQESIRQRKDQVELESIWDIYNWGTSIMKPGQVDIGEIANNSNMWADYLIDRFSLDVPASPVELEIVE